MLGNQIQKGNCCGGYNFFNEDFIAEMFRQGYPKHQVVSVTPYTMISSEDYGNYTDARCAILYGYFTRNQAQNVNLDLKMIDQDGRIIEYTNPTVGERNDMTVMMPAIIVEADGAFPFGWAFVGWQVELLGPVIASGGLQIDFSAMIGGSYPVDTPLTLPYNLQCYSSYYSLSDASVILPPNVTSAKFSIDVNRLEVGVGSGIYETYQASTLANIFRLPEGTITINDVQNINESSMRIVFTVSGIYNPVSFVVWLEDVALMSESEDAAITIDANAIIFYDLDNAEIATANVAVSNAAPIEGHVKGLVFTKNRQVSVTGTNTGPDTEAYYNPFGAVNVSINTAVNGAFNAVGPVDYTLFEGVLFRQPAIRVSIGAPA